MLLAAVVALGITVYQAGSGSEEEQLIVPQVSEEELAYTGDTDAMGEEPMVDAGTSHVEAEMGIENSVEVAEAKDSSLEDIQGEETAETAGTSVVDEQAESMLSQVNFTEDTLMEWPVEGTVVMDYSMDKTVYFPTLDVYKVSPAIAIGAEEGTAVKAAVTGIVSSIEENEETGTTVVMDLGNGYEAVYGQLKDLTVSEGETVETGVVFGAVNAPTKYYSVEGSNAYFAMRKDGVPVDPITYLP